jgi:hypothetical protein
MQTKRFITALNRPVDCDVEKRTLRGAVFSTTGLASDGMIVLPMGIDLARFNGNPVITDRHMVAMGADGKQAARDAFVIANAVSLEQSDTELRAPEIRFVDTQIGRDYAHLYGVNAEKQAAMRAWSVELPVLETKRVSWEDARAISAQYWDEPLAERMRKLPCILVAVRSELKSVAAVPVGADRGALTRAAGEGCATAGLILARLDLGEADREIETLRMDLAGHDARLEKLEEDILALRRDGAAAAARGDTAEVLETLRAMRAEAEEKISAKHAK